MRYLAALRRVRGAELAPRPRRLRVDLHAVRAQGARRRGQRALLELVGVAARRLLHRRLAAHPTRPDEAGEFVFDLLGGRTAPR